jgi:hypothetical protein
MSQCGQCFVGHCKRHPLQDHGARERAIRAKVPNQAENLKKAYDALMKKQAGSAMEPGGSSHAEQQAYRDQQERDRAKAEKRSNKLTKEQQDKAKDMRLGGHLIGMMLDSDDDDDDSSALDKRDSKRKKSSSSTSRSDRDKEKEKKRKREKKEKKERRRAKKDAKKAKRKKDSKKRKRRSSSSSSSGSDSESGSDSDVEAAAVSKKRTSNKRSSADTSNSDSEQQHTIAADTHVDKASTKSTAPDAAAGTNGSSIDAKSAAESAPEDGEISS